MAFGDGKKIIKFYENLYPEFFFKWDYIRLTSCIEAARNIF